MSVIQLFVKGLAGSTITIGMDCGLTCDSKAGDLI